MVHGAFKADACLRVRRYKHALISLQFPHAEIICSLKLMSTKVISDNSMGLCLKNGTSHQKQKHENMLLS